MLLARSFAHPRVVLVALAGALLVCSLVVVPQGRALASALVLFFRGQAIQPVATDYAHLQNGYRALEELQKLGALQGRLPTRLTLGHRLTRMSWCPPPKASLSRVDASGEARRASGLAPRQAPSRDG